MRAIIRTLVILQALPKCHTLQRNKVPALTEVAGWFVIAEFRYADRVDRQKGNSVRFAVALTVNQI
jgi:hypothetical protein